jgi:hypothetical protein
MGTRTAWLNHRTYVYHRDHADSITGHQARQTRSLPRPVERPRPAPRDTGLLAR